MVVEDTVGYVVCLWSRSPDRTPASIHRERRKSSAKNTKSQLGYVTTAQEKEINGNYSPPAGRVPITPKVKVSKVRLEERGGQ